MTRPSRKLPAAHCSLRSMLIGLPSAPPSVAFAEDVAASLDLLHHHAADRVTRAEGADDAEVAGGKLLIVEMKGDDRAGGCGIGEFVEDDRRFVGACFVAEQTAADQLIHGDIGLMQPEAAHVGRRQAERCEMLGDVRSRHRAHVLEYLAAFLDEELIARIGITILAV